MKISFGILAQGKQLCCQHQADPLHPSLTIPPPPWYTVTLIMCENSLLPAAIPNRSRVSVGISSWAYHYVCPRAGVHIVIYLTEAQHSK